MRRCTTCWATLNPVPFRPSTLLEANTQDRCDIEQYWFRIRRELHTNPEVRSADRLLLYSTSRILTALNSTDIEVQCLVYQEFLDISIALHYHEHHCERAAHSTLCESVSKFTRHGEMWGLLPNQPFFMDWTVRSVNRSKWPHSKQYHLDTHSASDC